MGSADRNFSSYRCCTPFGDFCSLRSRNFTKAFRIRPPAFLPLSLQKAVAASAPLVKKTLRLLSECFLYSLRTFEAVRTFYAQNDIKVMLPDLQNDSVVV